MDLLELKQDVKEIKADLKELSKVIVSTDSNLKVHITKTASLESRLDRFEANSKWAVGLILSGAVPILIRLFSH